MVRQSRAILIITAWPRMALRTGALWSAGSWQGREASRWWSCKQMPSRTQITRHDCVEGWSCIGKWEAVRLGALLDLVSPLPEARCVMFFCADAMDLLLRRQILREHARRRRPPSQVSRTKKTIRPFYRSCRQRGMEIGDGFTMVLPRLRPEAADRTRYLSEGNFVSFTARWPSKGNALVAIKSDRFTR